MGEGEGFISGKTFVLLELAVWFGFVLWFGWSQIRAVRRPADPPAERRDEPTDPPGR